MSMGMPQINLKNAGEVFIHFPLRRNERKDVGGYGYN